jgi:hypothetical protein
MPNQPASRPEDDRVLRLVGARRLARQLADGDREDLRGITPRAGACPGATPVLAVVDDDRVAADGQLGAELEEVLPVERDGDVEDAAGVPHGLRSRRARGTTTRRRGSASRSSWS